ncbi:MAG: nucleotidyltransferase family protein [Pseudomonadota bacterium]
MGVVAILLASGGSRRFGAADKLTAPLLGQALIEHAMAAVRASRIRHVAVVVPPPAASSTSQGGGPDLAGMVMAFAGDDLDVFQIENADHANGLSTSLRAGLAGLAKTRFAAPGMGAAVLPADMPLMTPEVLNRLVDVFEGREAAHVVVPKDASGQQRNPVIWPFRFWERLIAIRGDRGGKALLAELCEEDVAEVVFEDETLFFDVDTQPDLTHAEQLLKRRVEGAGPRGD